MSQGLNVTTFWQPSNNGSFPTHIDIYGKGGFVAIITTTDLPKINDHITPLRRKEGMLVYDVTTDKYWRCISVLEGENDDNWVVENFGSSIVGGTGIAVYENNPSDGITTINLNAELKNLKDVDPNLTPQPNQVLQYVEGKWVAATIQVTVEGNTDSLFASSESPFLLFSADANLTNSKVLIGDGMIDLYQSTDGYMELYIVDASITNDKLLNSTISGVALGEDLFALTFGTGLLSGTYDGSNSTTLSIDFGTGENQVARGNHTHTLDELTDVTASSATEGDVLVYAGTEGWVNSNFIYGGSASSF